MRIDAFQKSYASRLVLDFPGYSLEAGNIYAVIGANGSGKSTLAKVLSGTEPANGGVLPLSKTLNIGYLPQKPYAFQMSLYKNVLLGGSDPRRADALIEAMGLSSLSKKPAKTLSGGECARMALARTLMQQHDLLILDEPCASMDVQSTMLAEDAILSYPSAGSTAIILITHSIKQAARLSGEILFLSGGRLIETGAAETMLHAPRHEQTKQFLEFYSI